MSVARSVLDSALIVLLFVGTCSGVDTCTITGKLSRGLKGDRVWAMTSDCLKSYRTTTNSDGQFIFDKLPSGTYKLMANGPGVWQEPTEEVFLRPGATVKMNLQLRDEGEAEIEAPVMSPLHGVIVDSKDRPVGGANINDLYTHETRSGRDSRFGFCSFYSGAQSATQQPGEIGLIVTHPEYETRRIPLGL